MDDQSRKTSISTAQLIAHLADKLHDLPELNQQLSADDLKVFFLERSGLLQQVGDAEVQFAHRSFQEYFTAEYFIAEKDWKTLRQNAGNKYWHETIQLTIGLCKSKQDNERFLTELLLWAEEFEIKKQSFAAIPLYLLVLRCKEGMREISPLFSKRLNSIIENIVPPRTVKIRDALSAVGELALPYLKRAEGRSIKEDHYCALALINMATPEAYVLLKDYFKDDRSSYIDKIRHNIAKMDRDIAKEAKLVQLMLNDGLDKFPVEIIRRIDRLA